MQSKVWGSDSAEHTPNREVNVQGQRAYLELCPKILYIVLPCSASRTAVQHYCTPSTAVAYENDSWCSLDYVCVCVDDMRLN